MTERKSQNVSAKKLPRLARVLSLALAAAGVAAVAPAPALAQGETAETSANVKFLKNIKYPLRWETETQEGTDMEFATITVGGAENRGDPSPPPVTRPGRTTAAQRRAHARCVKKAKKKFKGKKNRKKLKRAQRKCKRLLRPKTARSAKVDVDASAPGIQKTFAFAGSYNNGLHIIDVSNPQDPQLVTSYDCGISQADVQVFHRPDLNKWLVTFTSDDSYAFHPDSACFKEATAAGYKPEEDDADGTFIIDVTDPANPKTISWVHFDKGSHNQTVHPSGRYLYNSNSNLVTDVSVPTIEIADITDPRAPKELPPLELPIFPGLGSQSHDITFNKDGTRAYTAAVSHTSIIDTTDPASPSIVGTIRDPTVNVSHQAEAVAATVPGAGERTLLIVSDEFAGATPTDQCPNGGGHVYDITGPLEAVPVKLGYYNITEVRETGADSGGTCTSHVWQIHHDAKIMIQGWYNAGFRVLDLNEVAGVALGAQGAGGIKEMGFGQFPNGSAWSAKAPVASRDSAFSIYTNDQTRGFDAWSFDPKAAAAQQQSGAKIRWYPAGSEPTRTGGAATPLPFVCELGAK